MHIMGLLLLVNGFFMLVSAGVGWFYSDGTFLSIAGAAVIALILGGSLMIGTRNYPKEVQKKEGYLIVTLCWILMAFIGSLPYLMTASIPGFTDAFFESMSGFTATGATIIQDVESFPRGILFWRSVTHWIGGMGIIVMAIAIMPLLGVGGMQMFAAEIPGPVGDKLHPRITDTAKRLWLIYVGFTLTQTFLLKIAGMGWFDAVNHAMSTMASGGFSTKNSSLGFWNDSPLIQYIVMVFMFLAGTNFVLSYFALKGNFKKVFRDEEFRFYAGLIIVTSILTAFVLYFQINSSGTDFSGIESSFRHALFQVISIITTTAFFSTDFTLWPPFLTMLFFCLLFVGGSAGSTAGGVKIMRHLVLVKNGILEFKRSLHPHAILPVRFNKKAVSQPIVFNILGFFILYILSFLAGAIVFSFLGLDFKTSLSGSAACLGNIGLAQGSLGPSGSFGPLSGAAKWWAGFLMLLGRLELFAVLILLTPFFWKNK